MTSSLDRVAFSPTASAATRYWNMAGQRYCRRLARYRNTLRVSADPVAKPAAHTRAESRGSRPSKAAAGERQTRRWREPDSNRRSPVYGELGAPAPRATRPTRHREAPERRSFASTSSAGGVRHAGDQAEQVVERRPGMPPAVPPEGEFVEIALEVLFARAMERAGEPALQMGEHPMHPGQQDVCRHAAFRLARMPVFPELHVAGQTVAATPAIGLAGTGVQIDPETGPKRPL
jgi:hypothetical protein